MGLVSRRELLRQLEEVKGPKQPGAPRKMLEVSSAPSTPWMVIVECLQAHASIAGATQATRDRASPSTVEWKTIDLNLNQRRACSDPYVDRGAANDGGM